MFDDLGKNFNDSFGLNTNGVAADPTKLDYDLVDDILVFTNKWAAAIPAYNKALQDVQSAMAKEGFDLFNTTGVNAAKALTGAIKGVSEETASVLAGSVNGIRMNQIEGMNIMRNQLFHLANIDNNTFPLHSMKRSLDNIERQIVAPNINMLP